MAFINVLFIKDAGGYVLDTDSFPADFSTLQKAYEGGNAIIVDSTHSNVTMSAPVAPDPSTSGAVLSLYGAQDAYPLQLLHQGTDPTTPALGIFINSTTGVILGIDFLAEFNANLIQCRDANSGTSEIFALTAQSMTFPSDTASGFSRGTIQTGTGQIAAAAATMVVRGGEGSTDTTLAGPVSVGHAISASDEDGGFLLDPTTGRMQLRAHDINGTYSFGALGLVDNDSTDEGSAIPADGDLWYRSEVSGDDQRRHGFRPYRGGFALMGRGGQVTFQDDDLDGANIFSFAHGLDTPATIIQVFNPAGVLQTPDAAGPVLEITADPAGGTASAEFDPAARPLAAGWYMTVIGF